LTFTVEHEWVTRKKTGGNRKMKYIDVWVEFSSKHVAKLVAMTLNNTPFGGKKRHSMFRDDI
jgi:ESF2/ABP1 family protein